MKSNFNLIRVLSMAVLVIAASANAEPLAKRGSYSGVFGWHISTGETIEVAKDHLVWGGAVAGAFRNDAGSGFLHAAAAICTFSGEFKKDGVTHNNGDCVATDRDGDKASFSWRCTTCPGTGELRWTGGTGKYAGIVGRGSFQQTEAGPPGSRVGWSAWKGEWELP
jgi:hypothetical protein